MRAYRLLKLAARLVQWSLWLLLGVALLLALAVAALHWWIVPRINDFRPQVESRLSTALGLPVRIDQLQADGGSGLVPDFAVQGIHIQQADGADALTLNKVHLALSVRSLLRLRVDQITIDAPQLQVQRAADGSLRIAGIALPASTNANSTSGADWIFSQRELVLRGGSVTWDDQLRGLPPVTFSDVQLLLRNPGLRHEWQISVRPPMGWGDALELRGRFRQPIWALHDGNWKHWSGQLYAEAAQLNIAPMAPYLPAATGVEQGEGTVRLWLDVTRGQLKNGTADVALRNVGVRRAGSIQEKSASNPLLARGSSSQNNSDESVPERAGTLLLRSVQGRIGGVADDTGFRLVTEKLAVESANGQQWPGGSLRVNHVYARAQQPSETDASAQDFDIASLAEVVRSLPVPATARQWVATNRPAGLIRSASAHWRGDMDAPQDWRLKADVTQLALGMPAAAALRSNAQRNAHGGLVLGVQDAHIGLKGLDVSLDAGASGGSATLHFANGALYLPSVFEDPVIPLDEARTQFRWTVQGDQVQLQSDGMTFANADAAGQARWSWRTSDPATSPSHARFPGILELQGSLQRANGTKVHRYLPLDIPPEARHYVRDAVQAGRSSNVQFEVKGDLKNMPFSKPGTGVFRIAAQVRDVRYAYVPDSLLHPGDKSWPVLTKLSGELVFSGAGMQVGKVRGTIDDNDKIVVEQTSAKIEDFHQSQVLVNAQARGPLADMLTSVNRSAIGALTHQAMAQTVADGDAQLALKLDLPVHQLEKSKVDGRVQLAGNRIQFHGSSPVVSNATGVVAFSEHGFALQQLQGQALGGTAQFSGGMDVSTLAPGSDPNSAVDVRVSGTATAEGVLAAKELGRAVELAQFAQGQALYQLRIGMAHGEPQVEVRSDLQGVALKLPAPLNKPAAESWPTQFSITAPDGSSALQGAHREQIAVDVGGRLQVKYLRELPTDAPAKVLSGAIRLGAGALSMPAKGVAAELQLAKLNVQDWLDWLEQAKAQAAARSGAAVDAPPDAALQSYLPDHWHASVDLLQIKSLQVQKLDLRGSRSGQRWSNRIQSSLMDGEVDYLQEAQGPGTIRARLSQMRVGAEASTDKPVADAVTAPAVQPTESAASTMRSLPALDIVVNDLRWRSHPVGQLEMQAVNRRQGTQSWWHLRYMSLNNEAANLQASGDWGAVHSASAGPTAPGPLRTQLNMRLDLKDTGELLARLGMPGVISRGKGVMEGAIGWTGSPLSPDYTSMDGKLHLDVGQGQFLKVEPGMAKLLGVLSLQALPRRLTLDFTDIFSAGFGFDFVRGDVTVSDGVASTNNLQMKGAAAAVLLEGHANLRDETQNLHVLVIPELNTTTLSLVTTAINPLIGLGSFVAQALLKKPLTDAVTREFQVTGSWTEPEVKRLSQGGPDDKIKAAPRP